MPKKFRVRINRDECITAMACVSNCPEVFEINEEDSKSQIVERFRVEGRLDEGVVPEEFESCVKSAAEMCPVLAIQVEEEED